MDGIESLLANNISAIVTAGGFIYYLLQKDKLNRSVFSDFDKSLCNFNKTLKNHLASQIKQQIGVVHAQEEMAKAFQKLTDCIVELKK